MLTVQESSYQTIVYIFSEFIPTIADTLGKLTSINAMRFPQSWYKPIVTLSVHMYGAVA